MSEQFRPAQVNQPANNVAVGMYESWKHGWKETLSSLTPLIVLGLIFIAAWCTADPLTELFRAQLERIRESNNFDEVTPFYLVSFMVMVLLIPMYVCFFQYVANPTVFYRNRKKFIAISLIISSSMFLALFLNTVGIAVEFGWPVSMKWTFVFWLEVVMVPLLTIGGILYLGKTWRQVDLPAKDGIHARMVERLDVGKKWRICIAASAAMFALVSLLLAEIMLPDVSYSTDALRPLSFAGTPIVQLTISVLFWLILFNSLSVIKLPGMAVFLGLCLVWAFFDVADNHRFRQSQSQSRTVSDVATLFRSWLHERNDIGSFKDKYYPIYIVAAEGGGMYAAFHTATVLGRIQDAHEPFAQHVFAISSVSGGSLGAALFSGLVGRTDRTPGKLEAEAGEFLSQDLLSNVVVRATMSDLAQRAVPYPFHSLDRALGLEYAAEKAWQNTIGKTSNVANPFAANFLTHWQAKGVAPALLLNTTEVETGDRVVISPFSLHDAVKKGDIRNLRALQDDVPGIDLPLSTAVVLSARFPYVTPSGYYMRGRQKHRLVDGGYFDNTGIETAIDLIRMLASADVHNAAVQNEIREHGLKGIRFILLAISTMASDENPSYGFDEIMSPARTMIATWRSRASISIRNADRELVDPTQPGVSRFRPIVMASGDTGLPLTWYLSAATRNRIRNDLAATTTCTAPSGAELLDPIQRARHASSCILRNVISELRAD